MILKIKARVKLTSETDMELEEMDLGMQLKSAEWVWRDSAILVDQIYRITAYSPTRSIIQMYGDEKILVAEKFDALTDRWEEKLKEVPVLEYEDVEVPGTDNEEHEGD